MNGKQLWVALAAVVTVVSLWLLAGSVSSFEFAQGRFLYQGDGPAVASEPTVTPGAAPAGMPDWARALILIAVWVLLPASLVLMIFRPRLFKTVLIRSLVVGLWALIFLAFVRAFDRISEVVGESPADAGGAADPDSAAFTLPDPTGLEIPEWTSWLAALLAVALGGWLLYRFLSYWGRRPNDTGLEAALAGEAGQAAQALRQGDALRAVVVRCYQAMCEVLQGRQRFAAHSLTPREFERRLGEAGIQDPLIGRLSRLFERVRYGPQGEGQNDKREALSCLEGIEQKYGEKP